MADSIKYLSLAGLTKYDSEIKKYIDALLDAANGDIDAVVALVNTLIGDDASKSVRTIANEELAAQLLSGDAEADFKTLQELAAWLEDHPEEAAAINLDLQSIHTEIGVKATTGENATAASGIYKYVDDAVAGKNVDAEGDGTYVAASAEDNKVTVTATYGTLTKGLAQGNDNKLAGNVTATNGIAKAEDVKAVIEENEKVLATAYNDHEDRLVVLEGTGEGSVAKALADANDYTDALKDTSVAQTAKTNDEAITLTVGGTVGTPTFALAHNFVAVTDAEIVALFAEEEEKA